MNPARLNQWFCVARRLKDSPPIGGILWLEGHRLSLASPRSASLHAGPDPGRPPPAPSIGVFGAYLAPGPRYGPSGKADRGDIGGHAGSIDSAAIHAAIRRVRAASVFAVCT